MTWDDGLKQVAQANRYGARSPESESGGAVLRSGYLVPAY